MKIRLLILLLCLPMTGCVAGMVMNMQNKDNYRKFRMDMEQLNFQREQASLQPNPIPTFEQWEKGDR